MSLVAPLEHPRVFHLTQRLNPMTVSPHRTLLESHVVRAKGQMVGQSGHPTGRIGQSAR